ncbi:MAG: tripartite tricarboxylate transporter substrate binding protein [Burkholderiaceae bacterium]|nr:tripartite tricarboxylate transporter substrate binding protein [Burkholderiaceae bacterium]
MNRRTFPPCHWRQALSPRGLLAFAFGALALAASAQEYPTKPVTLVVPFPAGGSTDVQARLVAKGLQERLGKPVVVDNKPGAAGAIGTRFVANAEADGHTLLFASTSSLAAEPVLNEKAGFDPLKDFAPVSIVTDLPWILVVECREGPKSVAALLDIARAKPGSLNYSSWGYGSASNLLGEMFNLATNIKVAHIPYKGEAPAVTGLIGGEVQLMFVTSVNMPHIQARRICPLAVTGASRLPILPDVPTFDELNIRNMDFKVWFGVVAPAKTPAPVLARLESATVAVVQAPDFARSAAAMGVNGVGSNAATFSQRLRADQAMISNLSKNAKIKE